MEVLREQLLQHSYPLASVSDGTNFADLQPLKEILRDVRILGLGESTHGTREFFQLKHRITRFMVEEMGYRIFSIEAGVMPCKNINDYIVYGKGDRAAALASQGYWTWDTEEVTEMIEWMRQHNLHCAQGDECRWLGYDIKPLPDAAATVYRLLQRVDSAIYAKAQEIIESILNLPFPYHGDTPPTTDGIIWLLGWIKAHEISLSEALGQESLQLLFTACRMIYQFMDNMVVRPMSNEGRNYHMAENIALIMNSLPADARIVVWAHNAHISTDPGWPSIGSIMRRRYGSQYFPCALTFTRGSFQSRLMKADDPNYFGALQEFTVGEPRPGTWENELAAIRSGDYFLNLRGATAADPALKQWAAELRPSFMAGGGYIPDLDAAALQEHDDASRFSLSASFDGIFHIENTTRARPTPTGQRDEAAPAR